MDTPHAARPQNTPPLSPNAPPLLLLSLLTAFGAMSIDIVLPGLPQMGADLVATLDDIQFVVGSFLIGIGSGQLLWGWLSDWKGRRPILLLGLAGYVAASLVCGYTQDGASLIACRFIQGFCAAAPVGLSRAVVRDCFDGKDAAKALATIMLVFFLTPMLAPLAGAALLSVMDWRAVFSGSATFGCVGILFVLTSLKETLPPERRQKRSLWGLLRLGFDIFALRQNRGVMLAVIGLSSGLFSYIALGPLITQEVFGYSPTVYAWLFAGIAAVQMGSAILCQRLLTHFSVNAVFSAGTLLCFAGGFIAAASVLLAPQMPWPLLGGVVVYMLGFGLVLPNATAMALSPFGAMAGLAAAWMGAWQTIVAGAYSGLAGSAYNETPLALGLALCGAGTVLGAACILNLRVGNSSH